MTHVAYYHDMGLGKTFTGSEKMMQLGAKVNLIVCQKSKIDDWCEHFLNNYEIGVYRLTDKNGVETFISSLNRIPCGKRVGIINYDLVWRRKDLLQLKDFTLVLDESSLIQNEQTKRYKFILKMQPKNVILLSGTPTGGKYEKLWSQLHLLGWPISKKLYWKQYIETEVIDAEGYPIVVVTGYKNVDRLKRKMREYGCNFLKTEEVMDLPEQIDQKLWISTSKEYRKFRKDSIVTADGVELVGDTTLTKMLYERQLCGQYSPDKLAAFRDLVESTEDRLIVFYNFIAELEAMKHVCGMMVNRNTCYSIVNGSVKDLVAYEKYDDSITFIQYQAGAMGLNLQKANKIVYFTPPLSSELFEQSKKRIHRIGQQKPCFYYYLTCRNSVEEKIYETLAMRKDYTEALFEGGI
jgi:SNF2 family DNA or RNA helicase